MNLIFFGTPQIAAYSLEKLHNSNHNILAVITPPDKPAGRGRKLKPSAVKIKALELGLKVLQPEKLKDKDFLDTLRNINPDLAVVVAFRKLPTEVWQLPKYGTINLHTSYLPQYRGAAPINWPIINGETMTGVTTFFINENIDEGDIIMQKKIPIEFTDTAGTLHDKIMVEGAELLIETVNAIEKGNIKKIPQPDIPESQLKKAPKINKEDTRINWNDTGLNIYNFIRGLSPVPTAWTKAIADDKDLIVKIISAKFDQSNHNLNPGDTLIENKQMKIAVKDGYIIPEQLIPQGKKLMTAKDFLNGIRKSIKFE